MALHAISATPGRDEYGEPSREVALNARQPVTEVPRGGCKYPLGRAGLDSVRFGDLSREPCSCPACRAWGNA